MSYIKHFAYFNFTCGNFTKGQGYVRYDPNLYNDGNYYDGIEQYVYKYLGEKGEKNCNIIFTKMASYHDVDKYSDHGRIKHQIDARWYSHLPQLVGMAVPIVVPQITKMLNEK